MHAVAPGQAIAVLLGKGVIGLAAELIAVLTGALEQAHKRAVERVLVTCYPTNLPSVRVIGKNGGVNTDTVFNETSCGTYLDSGLNSTLMGCALWESGTSLRGSRHHSRGYGDRGSCPQCDPRR